MTRRSLKNAFWDNLNYNRVEVELGQDVYFTRWVYSTPISFVAWAKNRIEALKLHEVPVLRRMKPGTSRFRHRKTKLETLCVILEYLCDEPEISVEDVLTETIGRTGNEGFSEEGFKAALFEICTRKTVNRRRVWRMTSSIRMRTDMQNRAKLSYLIAVEGMYRAGIVG